MAREPEDAQLEATPETQDSPGFREDAQFSTPQDELDIYAVIVDALREVG